MSTAGARPALDGASRATLVVVRIVRPGFVGDLVGDLVDLVLPRSCIGCRRPGVTLCAPCSGANPLVVPTRDLPVFAAGRYEAGLRDALLAYKERGRRDLAVPLGRLLALAVHSLDLEVARPVLVPVPSSPAARRERGGDHVARLARVAGGSTNVLRLTRAVRDSAGLDTEQRAANLAGAMRARAPRRRGCPAVIVDDITTTGASLHEAARALRAAGWLVVGGAVVAATPRRHPRRGHDAAHPTHVRS